MDYIRILTLFCVACHIGTSFGEDSCPTGWTSLSTGCYQFVDAGSYVDAMTNCENEGGYLVEIDNQEEQNVLSQFHKDSKLTNYVWLGGTDVNIEGQWIGSHSGRIIMDFNGWKGSEPAGGFNENCVFTHPSWHFKWNDYSCSWTGGANALCEYPDQVATSTNQTTDTCGSLCSSIEGCSLDKNTLMTTVTKLAKEFFISFEYKVTAYSGLQSMIHFTEDGDCCDVGKRIPGVWTYDGGRLYLCFAIDGNGDYHVRSTEKYPAGQWHQAEFSQRLENGKYTYRVNINGKNVVEVENKDPRIFSNVKVYAADPWYNPLDGSIRNLFINQEAPNNCGSIWEMGMTDVYIRNNDKHYKCDVNFEFNVNKETLITQFRDTKSECSDSAPKDDVIEKLGTHSFKLTSKSGITLKCSVGAAMVDEALSRPVLEDSLECNASNDPCSSGWASLVTGCYKFIKVSSYEEANNNCRTQGGYLAEIDNQEEHDALTEFHEKSKLKTYVWLGGTDHDKEGRWIGNYSGKEIMNFNGWSRNEPGGGFNENCVWLHYSWGFNKWGDYSCDYKGDVAALCEYADGNETETSPNIDPCSAGWTSLDTGCYKFVPAGSYEEATNSCRDKGGYLVEINNQKEQDVLAKFHQKSKLKTYVWLGGSDVEKEGQWMGNYSGKEIMNFNGWSRNEPGGGFNENCVWLHYSWGFNKWGDYSCDYKGNVAALCEYADQNETQTVSSTDSCSNGWTSLETGCYKFVKAGSYVEAMNNCKTDGGYLVEIDNQEEQNEVAIFHQKSKLRTYVWLGGTDVEIEGRWIGRHSGREIMNFNGWSRNEPGGGFNENCVWLHYSWGFNKWGDYSCDYKGNVAALCEYPDQNETQTTPSPVLVWERGMTKVYIGHDEKNYKCDVSFDLNVNNASLSIQFRDSKCSESSPKADEIQSFGNHFFTIATQSGSIVMKCSVGVVMVNGQLSASILAETLKCIATNDSCAIGWISLPTGCYKIVKAGSYQEGIDNCENEGGLLVEINSQEEQNELKQFFVKSKLRTYVWLGGTDVETEGEWIGRQSQQIMNFTAWRNGEPNGGLNENCIFTYYTYSFQWMDYSCSWKGNAAALCENSERIAIQTQSTALNSNGSNIDICQNGIGEDYSGSVSKTTSGLTCQKWTSQSPHSHIYGSVGGHNYCRNPDSHNGGVWCYTTNPDKKWELCDVPVCGVPTTVQSTCPPTPSCPTIPTPTCPTRPTSTCPPTVTCPTIPEATKCPTVTTTLTPTCPPIHTCPTIPEPTKCPTVTTTLAPTCPPIRTCPTIPEPTKCPTLTTKPIPTCPAIPACPTTVSSVAEACSDKGCKNAFKGLGMCVDTSIADWSNVSKIIDFTAETKDGKCGKDCNCKCFKHTGCFSSECDAHNGICLIQELEDDNDNRAFFIPSGYSKAFPCDESLDCHCYLRKEAITQKPRKNCKQTKKCTKRKGKCYGKGEKAPKGAKLIKGMCVKKSGCKCFKK